MSDADARRNTRNPKLLTEKTVLTEFLKLYESFPCLWDQKHMLYSNKEARQNAYEVLLEKYKLIQEDAVLNDVKKKLEHMRCAYRREYKRVINVRLRNGGIHVPILWYYNLLTFLNGNSEKLDSQHDDSYHIQETHEIEDSDDDEPEAKKGKTNSSCNALYVSDHLSDEVSDREELSEQQDQDYQHCIIQSEPEAFGRTVGYQLKELTHIQRIYAEKLISDVIFQARLGKLNADSTLNLNNEQIEDNKH